MQPGSHQNPQGDTDVPSPAPATGPRNGLSAGLTTLSLGIQHVVAMFGATFVFPLLMGLDPNLAIMMSGICTILFLLIVNGKVPSYLGSSASFVAAAVIIAADGGGLATITGAVLVTGVVLALAGFVIHLLGPNAIVRAFPPAVTGGVVMLIGFNLAPVVSESYWPYDQWTALLTMAFVILATVVLRGFLSRITVLLGLVFGFVLSWVFDRLFGMTPTPQEDGSVKDAFRVDLSGVADAPWFGLPEFHAPEFHLSAILVALPAVIALIAENAGHVKAVQEMTGNDLNPYMGRAIFADGVATALASSVGGAPTTTYAENIGVMAITRVYSTAPYYVAAVIAILIGLCPKFGALVYAIPQGVIGGITVILYGMIGLLGAKIWVENQVNFADPLVLVPIAAGLIAGIGNVSLVFTDGFQISGIALGTIVILAGYHLLHALAPRSKTHAAPSPGAPAGSGAEGGKAEQDAVQD